MSDAPETVVIPPGALASSSVRVDTWLWATRHLKSRSQVLPYIAALIAVVAAAATVALVVALSASDMRPDLDTLDAIGAAPTMRRHVTTWQGVVLALNAIPTAVLSGLIVGVLAVITFARSNIFPTLTTTLQPVVPWGALLGMLIGMPLLCALVAIVLTPRNQKRIRRIN